MNRIQTEIIWFKKWFHCATHISNGVTTLASLSMASCALSVVSNRSLAYRRWQSSTQRRFNIHAFIPYQGIMHYMIHHEIEKNGTPLGLSEFEGQLPIDKHRPGWLLQYFVVGYTGKYQFDLKIVTLSSTLVFFPSLPWEKSVDKQNILAGKYAKYSSLQMSAFFPSSYNSLFVLVILHAVWCGGQSTIAMLQ